MSKSIKSLFAVSLLAVMAACASNTAPVEEFVVIDPVPVTIEPVYTSK